MKDRDRDQLITLQTLTTEQDSYGEEIQTWVDLGDEWAAVFYGRGDERRQAAVEQGRQSANFQTDNNAMTRAVTLKERLIHDGFIWDVVGISPAAAQGLIEFTAMATGEAYVATT